MEFDGFGAQVLIENSTIWTEPSQVGGGDGESGGPSGHEQSIFTSMRPWDPSVWSDDTSMMTEAGFLYVDRDQNGWFDYVEWSEDDDTIWVWDDEDGWHPEERPAPPETPED